MTNRAGIALAGLALCAAACACSPDPASATCLHILKRRLPDARVVAVATERGSRAAVDFQLGEDRAARRLTCAVERTGSGSGWRVRSARLDGAELTDAELTVVNADLFLRELARAGALSGFARSLRAARRCRPGPQPPERFTVQPCFASSATSRSR